MAKFSYFLVVIAAIVVGQTVADCPSCPNGWATFGEYCYKLSSGRGIYETVEKECTQMRAYVAAPHSDEEFKFMLGMHDYLWINCNDHEVEGEFKCCDGMPTEYRSWRAKEPNNLGNEDCVMIAPDFGYNDVDCQSHQKRGICKKHVSTFA